MKPNFEEMSKAELKAYVLSHRDDDEAIRVFFGRRNPPDSEATWYGPMCTPEGVTIEENIRIAEEAIRQKVDRDREKPRAKELDARSFGTIDEGLVNSKESKMTVVTQAEIEKFRIQLADNPKALADLQAIERCEGDLQQAARVLARRAGVEEVKSGSNWQVILQKAREIACDGKFKDGLLPGLIGALIGAFTASGSPILAAVATPVAIYITQVSLGAFCDFPKSD